VPRRLAAVTQADVAIGDDDPVLTFVVRDRNTRELVGFFVIPEAGLLDAVDEVTDPSYCEYAELNALTLVWHEGKGPKFPDFLEVDDHLYQGFVHPPSLGHDGEAAVEQIEEWTPFHAEGWVYIIRSGDFVKIGYSLNPIERLNSLQVSSPNKMELLWQEPGGLQNEAAYHLRFRAHYERGEWFRYEGELREFLGE
jgi:hypothetical protein